MGALVRHCICRSLSILLFEFASFLFLMVVLSSLHYWWFSLRVTVGGLLFAVHITKRKSSPSQLQIWSYSPAYIRTLIPFSRRAGIPNSKFLIQSDKHCLIHGRATRHEIDVFNSKVFLY